MSKADITLMKNIELERKNRRLFYWEYDLKNEILYMDDGFFYGFSGKCKLENFPYSGIDKAHIHKDDLKKYLSLTEKLKAGESSSEANIRKLSFTGRFVWFHISYRVSEYDENKKPIWAIATAINVNEELEFKLNYDKLCKKQESLGEKELGKFRLNLNTNEIESFNVKPLLSEFKNKKTAQELLESLNLLITDDICNNTNKFVLSRKYYEDKYVNNINELKFNCSILINKRVFIVNVYLEITRNPITKNFILFINYEDVTFEFYKEALSKKVFCNQVKFLGWLDLENDLGYLKNINENQVSKTNFQDFYKKISEFVDLKKINYEITEKNGLSKFKEIFKNENEIIEYSCKKNECKEEIYENIFFYLNKKHSIIGFVCNNITNAYLKEKAKREEIKDALEKISKANKAKSNFLAAMSHDLRTPVHAIISLTELALEENNVSNIFGDLKTIHSSGRYLLDIINETLDISRIENGKAIIEKETLDLEKEVSFFATRMESLAASKGIVLEFNFNLKHKYFVFDKFKIQRILDNIVNNAIKFSKRGKKIRIECIEREKTNEANCSVVQFNIIDEGVGMTESECAKIFDRFYRTDSSIQNCAEGTGLGLSITKSIVEILNGRIEASSILGKGTTFKITIPMNTENTINKEEVIDKFAAKEEQNLFKSISGKKVLIVEDNIINASILKRRLMKFNIDSIHAKNGLEAIQISKENKDLKLIFMDIKMPVMDGYKATCGIRKFDSKIPIVAISANAFAEDINKSLKVGMNDHLIKPINVENLKTIIFKYLS